MDREDFFYEMAFREIETGELDKATWAKAFSLSTDDEHAKKLYIQYRVEKSKKASETGTPDEKRASYQNEPASRKLENEQSNLTQEDLDQNKKRSWLNIVVNIILVVTPARVVGDWLFSSGNDYSFDLLEVLTPRLDNGLSWLTMFWPFAFIYWLVKIGKVKGMSDITSVNSDGLAKDRIRKFGPFAFIYRMVEKSKIKGMANTIYANNGFTAFTMLVGVVIWSLYSWMEWGSFAISGLGALCVAVFCRFVYEE